MENNTSTLKIEQDLTAVIEGGQVPSGKIKISGAKNSATRLLAASMISDEEVIFENFPTQLVDSKHKIRFIENVGGKVKVDDQNNILHANSAHLEDRILESYNYPIRTTYLLVAGLIKKTGTAKIPYPGGCKIGNRGYDLHILVWEKLGATVEEKEDYILVKAPSGFHASEISFPITTIGGTENALICASTIQGITTIKNAYISPEVEDLIKFLRSMGARIDVDGNSKIQVEGRDYLKNSHFTVMPDRIEAITWLTYGIVSGGDITIEDVPFESMKIPLEHIREAGVDFYTNRNSIRVSPDCLKNGCIQPFEVATGTHPGVISDMQPFYVLLGLLADGISRVYDYRYPERVTYLEELSKFFPDQLEWEPGKIVIRGAGNSVPKAAVATSTDLRGSMALILAALLTEGGESRIKKAEMALRGYNNLKEKLQDLSIDFDTK